ncbi:MAG: hypothetical protein ABWX94_03285 [Candidatus Saccharimonadales bacterium]
MKTSNLTKLSNGKIGLAAVAAISAFAVLAIPTSANALIGTDTSDIGLTAMHQTEDGDKQNLGLRLLSQDGLENLGIASVVGNSDSDGTSQNLGSNLTLTDTLQDVTGGVAATNKDKDGASQTANLGLVTNDLVQDVKTNTGVVNQDKDGDKTQLGGLLETQDYLDSLVGGVAGSTQQDGDTTGSGLNFKFE